MSRLPPGQIRTAKFPVVGEKAPPPEALDLDAWRLVIDGAVDTPLTLDWPSFLALPQRQRTVDIHCVTGWSRLETTFTGVPLAELLERVGVREEARFVRFVAYSDRDHDTSLPLALALQDTWLVHSRDDVPLEPEHGYPLRTLTPSRYFYKSLKWLRRIELLTEDRLGYWERESAYHNVGDPWPGDQRFTSGSLDPEKASRFREAASFDRWRGKVLLGLDLRDWEPRSLDLHDLQLKNCDLRGAHLAGADLRGANLSLSDLRGADCREIDARGADLEGADFSGADLTGADLSETALSATRFVAGDGSSGAKVDGLRLDGASGLLGSQERYLAGSSSARTLRPEQRQALDYLRRKGTESSAESIRHKLAVTFADLDRSLLTVTEEVARKSPGSGLWSVQEVAEHLVASHRPAAEELAALVAGRRPAGEPIPAHLRSPDPLEASWPSVRSELAEAHRGCLDALAGADDTTSLAVRAPVVMVVRCATARGSEPVEWIEELDWKAYAMALRAHVLEHLRQIERTVAAV